MIACAAFLLLLSSSNALAQGTVATDRAALVALYNATGGANWTNNDYWLSAEPIWQWYGVRVGSDLRVERILLNNNNLTGKIPEELGSLTNLTNLNLRDNQLSGEIPTELGSLTSLTNLYLWGNQLSGEIPMELGSLTNLQELILYQNELSGAIPEELGSLTSLTILSLYSNELSGEIPEELGSLANLLVLYLYNNELSGEIPEELGSLTSLQEMNLYNNELSGNIPTQLGNLTNLQELILSSNRLSGGIPTQLGSMASLQQLYLWGNQLSGAIPTQLGSLTSLWALQLNDNALSGAIPTQLGNLTNLRSLTLYSNELSGAIPEELGSLTSLTNLNLSDNQLTGEIPEELGSLTSLQSLTLHGNELSGAIPEELGSLTRLQLLHLYDNNLSGEIPTQLGSLIRLIRLSLYDNPELYNYPAALGAKTDLNLLAPSNGQTLCLPTTQGGADCAIPPRVDKLRLTPSPTRIVVRWEPNPSDPAPTGYSVECDAGGWTANNVSVNGTTATISGLTPGSSYSVRVRPDTDATSWLLSTSVTLPGRSASTPTPTPTPTTTFGGGGFFGDPATVPSVPQNLTATAGNGEVVLSWDAPSNDGGAEIVDYEYRIDGTDPWVSIDSTETSFTMSGLENGVTYSFQVRAVNRIGGGVAPRQVAATPQAPQVFTLNFAHFANGASTSSDLVLVNAGSLPARPVIYFSDTAGDPIAAESVVDVTGDLEVAEDGGLTAMTEIEPLGELTISTHGEGELVTGSVRAVSSAVPIGGGLRFDIPAVGVGLARPAPLVGDVIFPVRRTDGGITTGVAIHNRGEEALEASCQLMSGGAVLEEAAISLEANGQTSWLIDAAFPNTDTSDFAGSLRCAAVGEGLFSAVAFEMDPAARIFTTLPLFAVNRRPGGPVASLDFAHFANGAGAASELVFVNVSTQRSRLALTPFDTNIPPIRPAVYFYDTEGNPIAADLVVDITGDLTVAEDGALTVMTEIEPLEVLTIATHGRGDMVTGSVKVVAEGPLGGMLRYNLSDTGEVVVGAGAPLGDAIFPVRRTDGGINTGVAIHNLEASPELVRCDLLREGVLLDSVSLSLAANGQTSWLIDETFPDTDTSDFTGSLRCAAVEEGLFTVAAFEMDPAARIFIALPVTPLAERTDTQ